MRGVALWVTVLLLVAVWSGIAIAQYPPAPSPPSSPPAGPPSLPAAVKAQAKVAAQHAGFAAQAQAVSAARDHLQHVLVCIEGPKGKNVGAGWENPCRGLGDGVLVDLQQARANPSFLNIARTADNAAVAGLRSGSLARMKAAAREVGALMTRIAQAK